LADDLETWINFADRKFAKFLFLFLVQQDQAYSVEIAVNILPF